MLSVENIRAGLAPHAATLSDIARGSICHGLDHGTPTAIAHNEYPAPLRETMASFVTLRLGSDLRGCVGTIYAVRPLVKDLARNAFLSAFRDPRFKPLAASEIGATMIEVSVLSPPEPVIYTDQDDLMAQLAPGRDGLILEHEGGRGLFLPQLWETLTDACLFVSRLKVKAGLPPKPLGPNVRALRFETVKFTE
jgi:AmmeMemoRadiSam system protein A